MKRPYGPDNPPRTSGQIRYAVAQGLYVRETDLVRCVGPGGRILAEFYKVFPPPGTVMIEGVRYYPRDGLIPGRESQGEFWERLRHVVLNQSPGASWDEVMGMLGIWRMVENPRVPDGVISATQAYRLRKELKAFLARMKDH